MRDAGGNGDVATERWPITRSVSAAPPNHLRQLLFRFFDPVIAGVDEVAKGGETFPVEGFGFG